MISLSIELNNSSIESLLDRVTDEHHTYIRSLLYAIDNKIRLLMDSADLNSRQYIRDLAAKFSEANEYLEQHRHKEETLLFPFVRSLIRLRLTNPNDQGIYMRVVECTLAKLRMEHHEILKRLKELVAMTNIQSATISMPFEIKLLSLDLQSLEMDIHNHIFIENSILFPKLLQLEKELTISYKKQNYDTLASHVA